MALLQEGIEILQDKGLASISAKYVIRSTVLGEDDLRHANAVECMKSTLQISDLRGSDTANVTKASLKSSLLCLILYFSM